MRRQLIVNPVASGVTPALVERVERELAAAGPIETVLTGRKDHGTELAAAACSNCEAIYVLAGDGGYNEVVNGLHGNVVVGFIPGGATSVLPRALGLPRDPVECARRLARSERRRTISLGRANGRRFAFCWGVGLDAEVVRAVDRRGRAGGKRAGDLAFVVELARTLRRKRGMIEPQIEIEGHGRFALAIVANCDPYTYAGPLLVHVAPRARFELGIDLMALRTLRARHLPTLAWWLLVHPAQERSPSTVLIHDADRIVIRCDGPLPVQMDGEDVGDAVEIVLEAERDALQVLV